MTTLHLVSDTTHSPAPASPLSRRERNLGVVADFWVAVNLTPEDLADFAAIVRGADVTAALAMVEDASVTAIRRASRP